MSFEEYHKFFAQKKEESQIKDIFLIDAIKKILIMVYKLQYSIGKSIMA